MLEKKALKPLSYFRKHNSDTIHKRVVRLVANRLHNNGYRLMADHIGLSQPPEMNGYIPDIVADINGSIHIIEVETLDSYKDPHSIAQLKAFSKTGHKTSIVIPCDEFSRPLHVAAVRTTLRKHGLSVTVGACDITTGEVMFF
ncbi:hypothetical protein BBD41_03210 [Paenibacillus ihbetae]|uniref:Uncharacterized protein n=1 Tax=Paenibacillus ihbetae TaxID=1870820 RepID=A0A1B2DVC9_9BACL|nr:hypothetical protein [Paenibacillus ihbetae]ANY71668.1 hypothetical protein BBD41_03210 [Paenibacillus ihbetae]